MIKLKYSIESEKIFEYKKDNFYYYKFGSQAEQFNYEILNKIRIVFV